VDVVNVEATVDAVLAHSPAQTVMRRRSAGRLAALAYHAVPDPERFAAQLDWLQRHTRPVDEALVVEAVVDGRRLPDRAVLLTFDDGDRTVLEHALPQLEARGIPAVVYVVAGLVGTDTLPWTAEARRLWAAGGRVEGMDAADGRGLVRSLKQVPDDRRRTALDELRATAAGPRPSEPQLTIADLRRLEAGGVAVGNHSLTHPCLPRCDDATVEHEVTEAHRLLTDALGHEPRTFAYPNGDADDRAAAAVVGAGYAAGFVFDHRLSDVPPADPLRISRLRVSSDEGLDRFRIIVSGLHPALHHLRGRS
jgi:peptidoglycan/xylan/chitin deacetylase (PgdA/CDA1 family)